MTETIGQTRRSIGIPVAVASRAALCAVLAIVVTFSQDQGKAITSADRDPAFGLIVLGVYLLLQAALLGAFAGRLANARPGWLLLVARAMISAIGGILALTHTTGGVATLVPIAAVVFLLVGLLEVLGGVRRTERTAPGDALVVGGSQVVVGLALLVLQPQTLFTVGLLAAWGAVVAVFLGIAAASMRRKVART